MALTKKGYRPRVADEEIRSLMRSVGAICIEGPKWCGKTWTALNHAESAIMLGDPDRNFRNRKLVELDVGRAFTGAMPHLIDEYQDVPEIWDATKYKVDEIGSPGAFILTGSSNPKRMMEARRHSGAGRIGKIQLRTMSLSESGDSRNLIPMRSLFANEPIVTDIYDTDLDRLIDLILRGGWPHLVGNDAKTARKVIQRHVETIKDDMCGLDDERLDIRKLDFFLHSLARNESTAAGLQKIAQDGREDDGEVQDISANTAAHYLDLLQRLNMICDQPAWSPNIRSRERIGKKPKRHLADPSLSAQILGLDREGLENDLETLGFLFEALCERDLDIYARAMGGKLFHYRYSNTEEIDAVIELDNGRWAALEIKLGTAQTEKAAKNLLSVCRNIIGRGGRPPEFMCVISGLEGTGYRRKDGVYVVPIDMLTV